MLTVLFAGFDSRLAAALGMGSIAEGQLTLAVPSRRHKLMLVLASDRNAYALAEIRRFGASLTAPRRRRSIARMIADMLPESGDPHSLYILDRVAAEAPALVAIAQAPADHGPVIEPTAIAALQLEPRVAPMRACSAGRTVVSSAQCRNHRLTLSRRP